MSRLQLIGGPYDGYSWYPMHQLILSEFYNEIPPPFAEQWGEMDMDYTHVETGTHPTSGKFVSEDHVIMRGDLGDAEYLWAEHDRWEFLGLWVWCEELSDPVADWFDDIDE